jgi:flagellar hook-associated protein 3 FlgL
MRVTENTNYDTVRDSIRRTKERMEGLQYQSATLRKLNQPSDDPIAAAKIMELRTDKMNNEQFQMNGKIAEAFLNNTDHAMGELSEIVMRAKEIALNQSSEASSSEDTRLGVAEEVTQLFKQAVSVANRKIGDRFIFGGYKTQKPPVDQDGKYLGDDGQMTVEVGGGVFISMNIPGIDAFNSHPKKAAQAQAGYSDSLPREEEDPSQENVNIFDELQNFRIGLLTGDIEGIRNTLERFDSIYGKLVATRAKIGSRLQGLQSTNQSMERHNVTNALLSSSLEDADMAQVVSDLGKEETIFRSALASSKRLVQPTLLDFLK